MEHNEENPLFEETFTYEQLISLEVKTTTGDTVGAVTDILPGPSNDNLIVAGAGGEVLIPIIEDVIASIDLEEKVITIEPMDGLLDLNEKKPRQ